MSESRVVGDGFRRAFLLVLVAAISLAFLFMIRSFLVALLLAAIFTGLCRPVYLRVVGWSGGREGLAALLTLLGVLVVIIAPLIAFTGVVATQAFEVAQTLRPWISQQVAHPTEPELFERFALPDVLVPYQSLIVSKLGEFAGSAGTFLLNSVAAATRGTVEFFFMLFLMIYAMFFFLRDGQVLLARILYYMPLSPESEDRMVDRFVSVTRATIKGTLVIGMVQGGLAGLAFAVVGIPGAAFWGTVMAVLSIIPGFGTALVWIPGVVYLFATGSAGAAIVLAVWCSVVVGTVDNLLRPRLVGRDTEMSDLLILLSTLGGLIVYGAVGIVIGPILAALFVTVWDIYGMTFRDVLPNDPTPVPGAAE